MVATMPSHIPWRGLLWALAGVIWLSATGVGLALLSQYANTPAPEREDAAQWPVESRISRSDKVPTLILFAHPRCPCTRATLGELEKIIADCQGQVEPWVVFYRPHAANEDWAETDLQQTAKAIPSVHVMTDAGGDEARLFKANTSGQTLLYDKNGQLLFNGGITFARGHAGDNAGRAAIVSILKDRSPGYRHTPVFGCSIASQHQQK